MPGKRKRSFVDEFDAEVAELVARPVSPFPEPDRSGALRSSRASSRGEGSRRWRGTTIPAYYPRGTNAYATGRRFKGVVLPPLTTAQRSGLGGVLHAGFVVVYNGRRTLFNPNDCEGEWEHKSMYPVDGFEKYLEPKDRFRPQQPGEYDRPMMRREAPIQCSYSKEGECLDFSTLLSEYWYHPKQTDKAAAWTHLISCVTTCRTTAELSQKLWDL